MIKFVFLMAMAWGMMWLFFRLMYPRPPKHFPSAQTGGRTQSPTDTKRDAEADTQTDAPDIKPKQFELKPCVVCGKHIADNLAIKKGDKVFCSAEHLTQYLQE